MPRAVFIACVLGAFILGAVLVAINSEPLQIELLFARPQLTAGQWLIALFIAGWIAGLVTAWHYIRKLLRQRGDLKRQLRLAESELRVVRPQMGQKIEESSPSVVD